jgi:hypothetical protein
MRVARRPRSARLPGLLPALEATHSGVAAACADALAVTLRLHGPAGPGRRWLAALPAARFKGTPYECPIGPFQVLGQGEIGSKKGFKAFFGNLVKLRISDILACPIN